MEMDDASDLKRKRADSEDEDDAQDHDADVHWYDDNGGFLDDESEPHRFGQPVLPVAILPNSFEGVPQDGMEYLFTVRREERRLPIVTRVPNPYAVSEVAHHDPGVHATAATSTGAIPSKEWRACFEARFRNLRANFRQSTSQTSLPSAPETPDIPEMRDRDRWWAFIRGDVDWDDVPCSQFHGHKRKRKYKLKEEIVVHGHKEALPQAEMVFAENLSWDHPEAGDVVKLSYGDDEDADTVKVEDNGEDEHVLNEERSLCESRPDEVILPTPRNSLSPTPAVNSPPNPTGASVDQREPTPRLLSHLDQRTTLHLLKYFTQWIQGHFDPCFLPPPPPLPPPQSDSQDQEQRLYELTPCHGRWIFALLCRLDMQLTSNEISALRMLARQSLNLIKEERSMQTSSIKRLCVGEVACWMIVAAVSGTWGQRDLWIDAANVLS